MSRIHVKDNLIIYLLVLLFAGYPAFSSLSVLVSSNLLTALYRGVILGLSLVIICRMNGFVSKDAFFVLIPLGIYALLIFTRIVYDLCTNESLGMSIYHYIGEFFLQLLIPTIAMLCVLKIKNRQEVVLKSIFIFSVIFVSLSLYLGYINATTIGTYGARWGTLRLNPISLGHAVVVCWSAFFCLTYRDGGRFKIKFILFSFIIFWLIFFTGSRGPLIAFLLLFIISTYILRMLLLSSIVVALISSLGSFLFQIYDMTSFPIFEHLNTLITRTLAIGSATDASVSMRKELYLNGWEQFSYSPFFGSGIEEKNTALYVHNIFLEGFMSLGGMGGMFVIFMLLSPLFLMYKNSNVILLKNNALMLFFSLTYLQYLVAGLFSGSLISSDLLFPALVGLVSLLYSSND